MQIPNRKKAPEGMYTAQEAIAIIGIPATSFYGLVNSKEINKITLPNRKEGFYSKQEIDNYARNLKALTEPYQTEKLDFGLALTEDLSAIRELTASVSGGYAHAVPEDVLKAWIRKNPQSVHILRKGMEIVGYISMFPVEENTLLQRLQGKLMNRTIPIDDIKIFAPEQTANLYIAEIAVKHAPEHLAHGEPDPSNPDPLARQRGARLIKETAHFIASFRKQRTIINEIYAIGTTPFGIAICRDLGMEPMDLPEGVREDRIPFKLNLNEKVNSLLIRRLLQLA
jgi:hypothetical protein